MQVLKMLKALIIMTAVLFLAYVLCPTYVITVRFEVARLLLLLFWLSALSLGILVIASYALKHSAALH
jgi:hypothetical protein